MTLSVTEEVTGSDSTIAKRFSFSASLDLDVTSGNPLTQPALTLASD